MTSQAAEQLFNGLLAGSSYALIALGLTLIYGVMGIVNFAHGEVYMLGAYLTFLLVAALHVDYFLALPLVFGAGLAIGPLINRLAFEPFQRDRKINTLISSLGLSIILSNSALIVFGPAPLFFKIPFAETVVNLAGFAVSAQRLFVFAIASLLLAATWLCLRRTRLGRAVRAVAENEPAAALAGINPRRVRTATIAVSTALASMAGALFAPLFVVNPFIGNTAGLKAFAVVVVGGFGNVQGTILAAVLLGIVESFATGYVSSAYRDAIAFTILLAALVLRPRGIVKEASAGV